MKLRVIFKTPDAVTDALNDQYPAKDDEENSEEENNLFDFITKFVRYGECVTIEFDSETKTAKVLPV